MSEFKKKFLSGNWKKIHLYSEAFLLTVLFFSIFNSIMKQLPDDIPVSETTTMIISKWEHRFKPIKKELPLKHGVICYIDNWSISDDAYGNADTSAEYILTQFTMSPIIISRKTNLEWCIINLDTDNFKLWFDAKSREYEVIENNYNLYLVHKMDTFAK